MALRLLADDEYMHDPGDEATFNESMYVNVFDPAARVGAFFRLGNRPNEQSGEMTVCCYLPDGRVGFMFQRPEVTTNDRFDAAGLRFEVHEPFRSLSVDYVGPLLLLERPLEMADPRRAFKENPIVPAEAHLAVRGTGAMFGGEDPDRVEAPGEEFARGHYEQHLGATGTITVDGEEFAIDGYGLRDHSWGARTWQAPWYYRWLTGNVGESFGFMGSRVARRDGEGTRGGFVVEDGELHLCRHFSLETTWSDDHYQQTLSARLATDEREWLITGRVLSMIPLRNRRESPGGELLTTRIAEGLTEWTVNGELVGYGMSEYLDQIVDGLPVGLGE